MKPSCRAVFLLLLFGTGIAGIPEALARKPLIAKVQATYKKLKDYHAVFEQRSYISLIEREVLQKGEISFARGGKFRLTYKDGGGGHNYVCDGKRIAVSDPALGTREVYRMNDPQVPQEALIFLGRLGSAEQFFKVKEGETKEGETKMDLVLIPKVKDAVVERLELKIDPKKNLVQEARIVNITGTDTRYVFTDARTDIGLPDQLFSID